MKTDWVHKQEMGHLLAALMPANRLALEISLATGLRISDVLGIKTEQVKAANDRRITVQELKTGKRRRVRLPVELLERALKIAGRLYVFENRLSWKRHRCRQTVWKDLKRVARAFRLKANVAPHSCRKSYAVEAYNRAGSLKQVQALLNHDSEAVTILYALSDELTHRRIKPKVSAGNCATEL